MHGCECHHPCPKAAFWSLVAQVSLQDSSAWRRVHSVSVLAGQLPWHSGTTKRKVTCSKNTALHGLTKPLSTQTHSCCSWALHKAFLMHFRALLDENHNMFSKDILPVTSHVECNVQDRCHGTRGGGTRNAEVTFNPSAAKESFTVEFHWT